VTDYAKHYGTVATPQSEAIPGREEEMDKNRAGGVTFKLGMWEQLQRFLILGCEGATYYASEKEMTKENASVALQCIKSDGPRVVQMVLDTIKENRAPKISPALFVLAMADKEGNLPTRQAANNAVFEACNIPTHLFQYAQNLKAFGGRGSGTRRGLASYYLDKDPRTLAYHAVKFQSRGGWSHRDLLRCVRPSTDDSDSSLRNDILRYMVKGACEDSQAAMDRLANAPEGQPIIGFELAKVAKTEAEVVQLIQEYDLVRECVPTEHLNSLQVWAALLEKMPYTAMVRNLGKMAAVGLLKPHSDASQTVATRIVDPERIKKARVHPIQLISALKVYEQGHGERGKLNWESVSNVVDALDEAFYLSFQNVEPTGLRYYIGLDVSDSMTCGTVAGVPGLIPKIAAAAMCMVHVRTEPTVVKGFTSGGSGYGSWRRSAMQSVSISKKSRLDDVLRTVGSMSMGGTDCALPMVDATKREIPTDVFVVYTDNETWAGNVHPIQALKTYRQKMGIDAKLVVVGMTSTGFTIADPADGGCLDVVGFDAAAPRLIADFAAGRV
jgi:60 kDa SS-A/Ro ribonucleoprotein